MNIRNEILTKFKSVNEYYLAKYLAICSKDNHDGIYESHHILVRHIWPEYTDLKLHNWNEVKLSPFYHIKAHYYFSLATDSCWHGTHMTMNVDNKLRTSYKFTDDEILKVSKIREEFLINQKYEKHPHAIKETWDREDELFELWNKYNKPRAGIFKTKLAMDGIIITNSLQSIVKKFFELVGEEEPVKYRQRRQFAIDNRDILLELWKSNGGPGKSRFKKIVNSAGIECDSCSVLSSIINKFRDEFPEYIVEFDNRGKRTKLVNPAWEKFDELKKLWIFYNKPKYQLFSDLIKQHGFNYTKQNMRYVVKKFIKEVD